MKTILLFDIPYYHPDGFKHVGDRKIRLYDPVTAIVAADVGAGAAVADVAATAAVGDVGAAAAVDAGTAAAVDAGATTATVAADTGAATVDGITQTAADAAGTGQLSAAPDIAPSPDQLSVLPADQVSALQTTALQAPSVVPDTTAPLLDYSAPSASSLGGGTGDSALQGALQNPIGQAPSIASMGGGQGLTLPESTVLGDPTATGTLSATGVTPADANPLPGPTPSTTPSIPSALKNIATNKAINAVSKALTPTPTPTPAATTTKAPLTSSSSNPMTTSSTSGYNTPGTLTGTSLAGATVYNSNPQLIAKLKQMYPQLSSVDPRILDSIASGQQQQQQQQGNALMASGVNAMGSSSTTNPYSAMLQTSLADSGGANPTANVPIAKEGGGTLDIIKKWQDKQDQQEGTQLMSQGLKMVGATAYAKDGGHAHVPEFITGATGHYVKGKGDGQSDDIPAMLADGEYVFDADTVASLGNGSSDAGAKLLDHFREALREHKRSAPVDKIPPAASPLLYMKEALKRHKKG